MEVDESATTQDDEIPPQLMFLHQGQQNMKELRFHPYYREMIITTAEDSFNIFRPNLDPDEQPGAVPVDVAEEQKSSDIQNSKNPGNNDFWQESEDEEEEEERLIRVAKKLNRERNRQKGEKKDKDGKRRKLQ